MSKQMNGRRKLTLDLSPFVLLFFFSVFASRLYPFFCLSFIVRYMYDCVLCFFMGCCNIIKFAEGLIGFLVLFVPLSLK